MKMETNRTGPPAFREFTDYAGGQEGGEIGRREYRTHVLSVPLRWCKHYAYFGEWQGKISWIREIGKGDKPGSFVLCSKACSLKVEDSNPPLDLAFLRSSLLLSQKLVSKDTHPHRRQPPLSKKHGRYLEHIAEPWPAHQVSHWWATLAGPRAGHPPRTENRTDWSGALGSLSHPGENLDTVEGTHFLFWPSGAEQKRSSEDFLLGRNPPSQPHVHVSAPVLVSFYKNLPPRTQGLACVST